MKKLVSLAIASCIPLITTADIMGQNHGFAHASTALTIALGAIALFVARRFQSLH